ncbi:hypothetical protein LPN04_31205 [Rugamonas sp. A1-17]|nr:hypothetical protein [Rugamonas sp. A1-17]
MNKIFVHDIAENPLNQRGIEEFDPSKAAEVAAQIIAVQSTAEESEGKIAAAMKETFCNRDEAIKHLEANAWNLHGAICDISSDLCAEQMNGPFLTIKKASMSKPSISELLDTQRVLSFNRAAALDEIDAILTFDLPLEQMKAKISAAIEKCRDSIHAELVAKKAVNDQSPTPVAHQPSFPPLRQVVETNLGPAGYLGGAWFKWWPQFGSFARVGLKGNVLWWIGENDQKNYMTATAAATSKTDLIVVA